MNVMKTPFVGAGGGLAVVVITTTEVKVVSFLAPSAYIVSVLATEEEAVSSRVSDPEEGQSIAWVVEGSDAEKLNVVDRLNIVSGVEHIAMANSITWTNLESYEISTKYNTIDPYPTALYIVIKAFNDAVQLIYMCY